MAGTQNVTVLFTDLVGSTQLSSSLSPEAADEVRRAHFSALREAIATKGGEEVKNLGDGLMVGFDATAPALSCAVAMQQAIERHNRKAPVPLAIRIGVSTGDVTVEDSDYFGDPVIESSRLCAVAQGGQILATDVVRALARRSGHSFQTERELELKGLPEPVVAWEVVWEPTEREDPSGIPLPPRLPQAPSIGLVGRKAELERLKEALKAATAGEPPRIVLISGEAGVGKSTLTSSLARDAHENGAVVLYGRCDEDLVVPHRPFVEALGHYLSHSDDATMAEVGDKHLAALAHLVPELEKRCPGLWDASSSSDQDAERWLLYGAVVALLERASAEAPVVLLLDDLHWADRPTLQLLRHVASHRPGRVLLLGTYRENDLSAAHPLTDTLAALIREASVSRMSLSGLEDDEVVSFVEAAAGQTLGNAGVGLAHALYQETDGNPFFMAEVLRHLVETRSIVQDEDGRWVPTQELADAGLPDSVRQVIGARVGRLGEEATRVLSAASVLGQEFDVELLAQVVGTAEDPVLDVLEAAGSSALVAEVRGTPGRFRFSHALVQHTLYDDLGGTRRSRFHAAAAQALEERLGGNPGPRAGELARHWLAATRPTQSTKAISYARLAGENALASLAPAEAIRWFNEALGVIAHTREDGERAHCLVGLGEAQRQVGDPVFRETLLEAAHISQSCGDVGTLVRAVLANSRGFATTPGTIDVERVGALEKALEMLPATDSSSRARVLALLAQERSWDGDYPSRRVLADQALAMARRLGDPATLLDVLLRHWQPVYIPDVVEELLAEAVEAEGLADQLDDPVGRFWAAVIHGTFSLQLGDIVELARSHETMARIASEVGQPVLKWVTAFGLSASAMLSGNIAQAEALANEVLELGTDTAQPDTLAIYGVLLLFLRWHEGRLTEIVDVVVQIASENPGLSAYRAAAAHALVESEREAEARDMLQAEMSSGFSAPYDYLLPSYLEGWARIAAHLNDRNAAEVLYPRLEPWPSLVVANGATVQLTLAHDLGALATVLGRYEAADVHFSHALGIHEKLRSPFFVALTKVEWAKMLLARRAEGDLARAEKMLTSARYTAESHGFAAVEKRAAEALACLS